MGRNLIAGAVAAVVLIGSAIPASSQAQLPGGGQRKILRSPTAAAATPAMGSLSHACLGPHGPSTMVRAAGGGSSIGSRFLPLIVYPRTPGYSVYNPYRYNPYAPYASYLPSVEDDNETSSRSERVWALRAKSQQSSRYSTAKAKEYIAAGDSRFAEGKYVSAVKQYQAAARVAPELAEPHFLHGLALVAHGNYAGAVRAFRRGMELRTGATDLSISLNEICGSEIVSATDQRIAARMQRAPNDGNLLAAQGMQFYFTGHRQRAALYLAQAAQLGALNDDLVQGFVPRERPATAAPRGPKALTRIGF